MAWNNDDERTDPNLMAPNAGQRPARQQQAQYPGQQQGQAHPNSYGQAQPGQQHYGQPQQHPQGQQYGASDQNPRTGGYPQQVSYDPQQAQQQWNQGPSAQPGHTPQYGVPQQVPGHTPQGGVPLQQAGGEFVTGAIPVLQAPKIAVEEDAKASRVVFGLSGMAVGGILGTLLGMMNTHLEGVKVVEATDFILTFAIWSGFFVGLLAYIFPARFAYGLERLTGGSDDD